MERVTFVADFRRHDDELLKELSKVRNLEQSEFARVRLEQYRNAVLRLHDGLREVNERVMHIETLVINP